MKDLTELTMIPAFLRNTFADKTKNVELFGKLISLITTYVLITNGAITF